MFTSFCLCQANDIYTFVEAKVFINVKSFPHSWSRTYIRTQQGLGFAALKRFN